MADQAFANGKKTALVTGASSGIGLELAYIFAREGYNLVLVARSLGKLEEIAAEIRQKNQVAVLVISKDLTQEAAAADLVKHLNDAGLAIEVLVNNAGFATFGRFSMGNSNSEMDVIKLNVLSLVHLTQLLLPAMLDRKSGKILNVSSTASFVPGPMMAVYHATKAFVTSFSESLAGEVNDDGITVTALCPGVTKTQFQAVAQVENTRLAKMGNAMDATTVAEAGYRGLMAGKRVVIPGIQNVLIATMSKIIPGRVLGSIVKKMYENKT